MTLPRPGDALIPHLMTYLCHELISPLSALLTGIEILKEGEGASDPTLNSILQDAAHNLRVRLEYFRATFSLIPQTTDQIEQLIERYCTQEGMPRVTVQIATGVVMPEASLVLLAFLWLLRKTPDCREITIFLEPPLIQFWLSGTSLDSTHLALSPTETLSPRESVGAFLQTCLWDYRRILKVSPVEPEGLCIDILQEEKGLSNAP